MRALYVILAMAWLVCAAGVATAADPAITDAAAKVVEGAAAAAEQSKAHEGLPLQAVEVFKIGFFPITNSMIVSWIVVIGLILATRVATRNMQLVPTGSQNFWEWLVESLHDFLELIVGAELVKRTFWFFATVFILILFTNWFGLLPGVGTIGWDVTMSDGTKSLHPWFRGGNADLNMTAAMAMIFFVMWTIWSFQVNGAKGVFAHIFGAKGDATGALKVVMVIVFFMVGVLEVVSILLRPVSLSFRLFGNSYAGENMLEAMATMVKEPSWLAAVCSVTLPIPFYFLEVLVGLVQALVFMLLTAVFTLLICQHDEEGAHKAAH